MISLRRNGFFKPSGIYNCYQRLLSSSGTQQQPLIQESKDPGRLEELKFLDLNDKIFKVPCKQSLISMMFMGQFDIRVLAYPEILKEDELRVSLNQMKNIKTHFARTKIESSGQDPLGSLGYNELWKQSATETCLVFEGIGASDYDSTALVNPDNIYETNPVLSLDYNLGIVRLMIHNCLVMPTIMESKNEQLKKRLLSDRKIAYCFTEKHSSLGVVTEFDWSAQAVRKDDNTWSVSGVKSYVLDDKYDDYMIFCRTTDYVQEGIKYPSGYEIPPCIIAFVVPKERLEIETFEEGGVVFQSIKFPDLLLTEEEHLLIPPTEDNNSVIHSKRALGQVAVSALLLGRMKTYFDTCSRILKQSRKEVQDDTIIQNFLFQFTRKVFSLESMVYLVAAMFDSFSERDMKLEGMATKIISNMYGKDMVRYLPEIAGNSNINVGAIDDYFGFWDGFLDGALYNHLIISLSGMRLVGPYLDEHVHKSNLMPFFTTYIFTDMKRRFFSQKNWRSKSDGQLNIDKFLDVDFHRLGMKLEDAITRLKWCSETNLKRSGADTPTKQFDLLRIGWMPIRLLEATANLSRGSRSTVGLLEGFDADTSFAQVNAGEIFKECEELYKDFYPDINVFDSARKTISRRNTKYGGYFAFSPLDKVHY